jgi:hypothetical protein
MRAESLGAQVIPGWTDGAVVGALAVGVVAPGVDDVDDVAGFLPSPGGLTIPLPQPDTATATATATAAPVVARRFTGSLLRGGPCLGLVAAPCALCRIMRVQTGYRTTQSVKLKPQKCHFRRPRRSYLTNAVQRTTACTLGEQ